MEKREKERGCEAQWLYLVSQSVGIASSLLKDVFPPLCLSTCKQVIPAMMKSLSLLILILSVISGQSVRGQENEEPDFPLATGEEAKEANARILELFDAIMEETPRFPEGMPSYREIPRDLEFTCADKVPGYYADVNYGCQVYHVCREEAEHGVASFLCPNATIFHQQIFACDWWFNVDCSQAPTFYYLNEDLYKDPVVEDVDNNVAQVK
ncbi:hypothetical protein SK128_005506 [Halocaridina rubra]|uniref:Chitin-binding type-2 domain-containing protein n=1 Tax=Halocaridina rubra TaxID=373956 RepID=A0AAN8ZVZ7_HALRR